jgi:cytochrome c oxidase subunit I+III
MPRSASSCWATALCTPSSRSLFLTSNALRLAAGYIGPRRSLDLRLTRLWQDFTAALGLVALAVVLILPILAPISEARP